MFPKVDQKDFRGGRASSRVVRGMNTWLGPSSSQYARTQHSSKRAGLPAQVRQSPAFPVNRIARFTSGIFVTVKGKKITFPNPYGGASAKALSNIFSPTHLASLFSRNTISCALSTCLVAKTLTRSVSRCKSGSMMEIVRYFCRQELARSR